MLRRYLHAILCEVEPIMLSRYFLFEAKNHEIAEAAGPVVVPLVSTVFRPGTIAARDDNVYVDCTARLSALPRDSCSSCQPEMLLANS